MKNQKRQSKKAQQISLVSKVWSTKAVHMRSHLQVFNSDPIINVDYTSWWLDQPLWKICSSNWIISPNFGMNIKKYLKLPPSYYSLQNIPKNPWKQPPISAPRMWGCSISKWNKYHPTIFSCTKQHRIDRDPQNMVHDTTHTVDGRIPAPVEVGSLSQYSEGSIHPRWCRISSINTYTTHIAGQ